MLFTPYLSDRELFDSTETDLLVSVTVQKNRPHGVIFFKFEISHFLFYL